ncbi:MAG: Asp-tRNA(Asn)/Glu-tRNA(Gln) amidotransferase subunit GatC [Eubacterium sp.]|nr:Asp-tRNA(Asn)/Glu-tRNA(Gln) amidotransferase subunit GatC [Eubacterium sp.]
MADRITDETIAYAAALAKLELSEEERAAARQDMERMLAYIGKLNELDTDQIEPAVHLFQTENVFHEDVVTNTDGCADLLANAPQQKGRSLVVPKTIS